MTSLPATPRVNLQAMTTDLVHVVLVRLLGVAGFVLGVFGVVVLLYMPQLPHSLPASAIVAGVLAVGGAEFLEQRSV